jgi:hypothetical protein
MSGQVSPTTAGAAEHEGLDALVGERPRDKVDHGLLRTRRAGEGTRRDRRRPRAIRRIDVQVTTSVWCLLGADAKLAERGQVPTTAARLTALVQRLSAQEQLLAGQEVGKLSHFVHDTLTAAGVQILSFNVYQLRIICCCRKQTDQRDSYWIAKALQTGMTPHSVHIPTGEVRTLPSMLSQRQALVTERRRWLSRARFYSQVGGYKTRITRSVPCLIESAISQPEGLDEQLAQSLDLCACMENNAALEQHRLEQELWERT